MFGASNQSRIRCEKIILDSSLDSILEENQLYSVINVEYSKKLGATFLFLNISDKSKLLSKILQNILSCKTITYANAQL